MHKSLGMAVDRQRSTLLLIVVVCAALVGTAPAQQWRGFPVPQFATASNPFAVTTGDFNGDGITDLVTAHGSGPNTVTVLLGNGSGGTGDGTFASRVTYSIGGSGNSVATGDFNGDGITDLATANRTSDNVSVLLNLGFTDITAPTSQAIGPSGSITQTSSNFGVSFSANDTHLGASGIASVELFYQRNGGGYLSYGSFPSSPIRFDTTTTGGNGTYDFCTIATDVAGNVESKTLAAEVTVVFNNLLASEAARSWMLLEWSRPHEAAATWSGKPTTSAVLPDDDDAPSLLTQANRIAAFWHGSEAPR